MGKGSKEQVNRRQYETDYSYLHGINGIQPHDAMFCLGSMLFVPKDDPKLLKKPYYNHFFIS